MQQWEALRMKAEVMLAPTTSQETDTQAELTPFPMCGEELGLEVEV